MIGGLSGGCGFIISHLGICVGARRKVKQGLNGGGCRKDGANMGVSQIWAGLITLTARCFTGCAFKNLVAKMLFKLKA